MLEFYPEAFAMAQANRAFLGRAVRFLAEAGIRQFLDIGTGIPGPGGTGEVAHAVAPGSQVVGVDNDQARPGRCGGVRQGHGADRVAAQGGCRSVLRRT